MSDERKAELKKAYTNAESIEEILKVFKQMESCFPESELGIECFLVANGLYKENKDLNQVLTFANRALTILTSNINHDNSSLSISMALNLLGSVYRDLKMYDQSLSYFSRSDKYLSGLVLEDDEEEGNSIAMSTLLDAHVNMCNIKSAMGRNEEAVVHSRKVLEIHEKFLEEGCVELGKVNQNVCKAYCEAFDHEGGLPFGLKALEIYKKCLGPDSVEVGELARYLSLIYSRMIECEKAFEYNQLAQSVLRKTAPESPYLVKAQIDSSHMLVDLGRYQEAVDVLMGVVPCNDIDESDRAKMLVDMARAKGHLKKFDDARKSLRVAQRMLEREGMAPLLVFTGYVDMSDIYKLMKDFETAISLIKRALAVPEVPQKLIPEVTDRLFSLMCVSEKEKELLPYMEGVVDRLKEYFGPEHYLVGTAYAQLGASYSNSGQKELAVKYMADAKKVLDVSLGPHHLSSLQLSHDLSVSYVILGRFNQALEIEEKVNEGLKGLPPGELGFMHEVNKHLCLMRERVAKSPTTASPRSNDVRGLSAKISECGISSDGKKGT